MANYLTDIKNLTLIILFIILTHTGFSQDKCHTKPSVGLCLGYNLYHSKTLEFGVGFQPGHVMSIGSKDPFAGVSLAYECPVIKDKPSAVSFNFYLTGGIALGLNINLFYNDSNMTCGLKPMIGIAYRRIALMWGYNFFLTENEISGLKHNEWTLRVYIPILTKK